MTEKWNSSVSTSAAGLFTREVEESDNSDEVITCNVEVRGLFGLPPQT